MKVSLGSFLFIALLAPFIAFSQEECRTIFVPRKLGAAVVDGRRFLRTDRGFAEIQKRAALPDFSIESFVGKKVLDVGCGGGGFVKDLRAQGVEAIGIDRVLEPAELATGFFQVRDAYRTEFPAESFDIVTSNYSIFLYENSAVKYALALKEFHRILKPGGRVILVQYMPKVLNQALPHLEGFSVVTINSSRSAVLMKVPGPISESGVSGN